MRWMRALIAFMVTMDIAAAATLMVLATSHINLFTSGYPAT